ncbi:hypothetical protein KJK32_09580 [Streptomyces sp. JCM17656]|nr:hypothetical protein KJK32_09580 [Streptomyces sp. JCM17656]
MAAGICGGLAGGLAAALTVTLLCVAVAAPEVLDELVLRRLADGGSLALVGVIICGFAFGRTDVRLPADWDFRLPTTGFAAAICYGLCFDNACGTVSALLYGITAATVGRDGVGSDPACPVARVRWHWSRRGVCRGLLGGLLLGAASCWRACSRMCSREGPPGCTSRPPIPSRPLGRHSRWALCSRWPVCS